MATKTVLVVLALFCTLQTMEASIVADMTEKMQQMVGGGLDKIDDLIKGIMDKMDDTTSKAPGMSKGIMEKISEKLKQMVEGANKMGADVGECMGQAKDKMGPIAKECENKVRECVSKVMDNPKSFIQNINSTIRDMRSKAGGELSKIVECARKSFIPLVGCAGEMAHAGLVMTELGTQIPGLTVQAQMLFPKMMQSIAQCSVEVTLYAEQATLPVITDTMKCVQQKVSDSMKGPTVPAAAPTVATPETTVITPGPPETTVITPGPPEETPVTVPAVETPAPAQVEETPAPAPAVETPAPAPVEDKPADDTAAPAS